MEVTAIDAERQRGLRRMKAVALGLLVAAAVVYVITKTHGGGGWVGYVRAFSEAAMVGALADWFAVTALFRHPLGLPIPHTAIIPKRKDQIGRSLGQFVETNFLTEDVLGERLAQARIGERVGEWLAEPENAERASGALGDALKGTLEVLDDKEVQHGLEGVVRRRIAETPAAPLVGRAIDVSIDGGHHQRLLDAILVGLGNFLDDNHDTFRRRLYEESPWWVPESIDNRVLEKIYDVVGRFLTDVRANPDHEMRTTVDVRVALLAQRLQHDPEMLAKGEELKNELLDHPEFRAWIESLWLGAKRGLIEAANDPRSELRARATRHLQQLGERISADPELQRKVDDWVGRAAGYVVDRYRSEVGDLIEHTVERWDGESTARKMELQVGRDLQFIRINGTLVGGLAGIVIHAAGEFL
ncbi:DUF445 domain-containing protein [Ilumatobacter sp.]|uniref:DUF445 domain-containing protein n=1 Tax=Ilumatobacter sp. TaxID=1967498 RepID=UPI003AF56445